MNDLAVLTQVVGCCVVVVVVEAANVGSIMVPPWM